MSARLPWTRGAVVLHLVGSAMLLGGVLVEYFTQSRAWKIGLPLMLLGFIPMYFSRRLRRDAAEPPGKVRWL